MKLYFVTLLALVILVGAPICEAQDDPPAVDVSVFEELGDDIAATRDWVANLILSMHNIISNGPEWDAAREVADELFRRMIPFEEIIESINEVTADYDNVSGFDKIEATFDLIVRLNAANAGLFEMIDLFEDASDRLNNTDIPSRKKRGIIGTINGILEIVQRLRDLGILTEEDMEKIRKGLREAWSKGVQALKDLYEWLKEKLSRTNTRQSIGSMQRELLKNQQIYFTATHSILKSTGDKIPSRDYPKKECASLYDAMDASNDVLGAFFSIDAEDESGDAFNADIRNWLQTESGLSDNSRTALVNLQQALVDAINQSTTIIQKELQIEKLNKNVEKALKYLDHNDKCIDRIMTMYLENTT